MLLYGRILRPHNDAVPSVSGSLSIATQSIAAHVQCPEQLALRHASRERSDRSVGHVERLELDREVRCDAVDRAREVQVREEELFDLRLRREERGIDLDVCDEALDDTFEAAAAADRAVRPS